MVTNLENGDTVSFCVSHWANFVIGMANEFKDERDAEPYDPDLAEAFEDGQITEEELATILRAKTLEDVDKPWRDDSGKNGAGGDDTGGE